MKPGLGVLGVGQLRLAVATCDRFEASWRSGERPDVEGYLGDFEGEEREVVRRELLALAEELQVRGRPGTGVELPRRIGGYAILGLLGRGGMGTVYRARQRGVGRVVALKVIRRSPADDLDPAAFEAAVARFRAEIRAAGGLSHPNLVEVYEAGRWDWDYYYAMRLIEGRTLAEAIGDGPIAGREAAAIVEAAARAVGFAHSRGVVHRDLKPKNILIDRSGRPFVADFGLAKLLDADDGQTRTGELLGSPPYMAPEQVRDPARVGPACDIYALGATLYEAIVGRPPFRAAGLAETLRQVVEEPTPRPRHLNPAVDVDLETICLKCLEKEAGRRYASSSDLADDLRRYLERRPIRARPIGPAGRLARHARRDPKAAALAATGIGSALIVLGAWWWSVDRDRRAAASMLAAEVRLADQQSASARQARRALYASEVRLACDAWDGGRVELARKLLDAQRPGAGESDHRGFEWFHLMRLCGRDLALRGHRGGVRDLAFSPDGATLATAGLDGTARLWDAQAWACRAILAGHGRAVGKLAFAADGRWLYTGGDDGTIRRWDVRDGREVARFGGEYGSIVSLAVAPDGRALAFHPTVDRREDPLLDKIWMIDPATGATLGRFDGHPNVVWALSFSPDGRRLASGSVDGIRLWDRDSFAMLRQWPRPDSDVEGIAFSPDGRALLCHSIDGAVAIQPIDGPRLVLAPPSPDRRASCAAYAPDGRTIACGAVDGSARLIGAASSGTPIDLAGHSGRVNAVAFSRTTGVLATGGEDGVVRLWDGRDGRPLGSASAGEGAPAREGATLGDPGPILMALSMTEGGAILAVGGEDQSVEVRDARSGAVRFRRGGGRGYVNQVVASPDGRALYTIGGGPIRAFDLDTGEPLVEFEQPPVETVWWAGAISPDGRTIVAGSGHRGLPGHVGFWDAATGRLLGLAAGHRDYVRAIAISPDGRTVASGGGDQMIRLWEPASRRPLGGWRGHDGSIFALAYSPDGRVLASGGEDQAIRLWDVDTGRERAALRGHDAPIRSLAFDPAGHRLASGASGPILLWDPASALEVGRLVGHATRVNRVAFAPDGRTLYSVGSDRTLRTWRAGPPPAERTAGGPIDPPRSGVEGRSPR